MSPIFICHSHSCNRVYDHCSNGE
uniref:Uncharacterized protein n=1 Tax=Anguilla anguilla TaxID=7936 RepID=A0A0E9PC70_ANGAN